MQPTMTSFCKIHTIQGSINILSGLTQAYVKIQIIAEFTMANILINLFFMFPWMFENVMVTVSCAIGSSLYIKALHGNLNNFGRTGNQSSCFLYSSIAVSFPLDFCNVV